MWAATIMVGITIPCHGCWYICGVGLITVFDKGQPQGVCGCGLKQNVTLWTLKESILNIIINYGLKGFCISRYILGLVVSCDDL